MLSDEDKKEIEKMIDQKIMDFALKLPSVISNLVMESTAKITLYKDFIMDKDNLEAFKNNTDVVSKIIMEVESNNPGKPYSEIIKQATPLIKERLNIVSKLNFDKPEKPTDLSYKGNLGKL